MKRLNQNQAGFTLVEIMIAVGLLGGLAVAGMSLFKNQNQAQKTVEANYEVTALLSQIRTVLSDQGNCTQSLGGRAFNGGTTTVLQKHLGAGYTPVYPIGVLLPGRVKVNSYVMDNTIAGLAPDETWLRISFSRSKSAIKDEITKAIKIVYTASGANINTCYAIANQTDSFWVQSTVDMNDIFYAGGDVGIGLGNPLEKLHIAGGNIRFDNAMGLVAPGGARLRTGPNGSTWQAYAGTSANAAFLAKQSDETPIFGAYGNGQTAIGNVSVLTGPAAGSQLHMLKTAAGSYGPTIFMDNNANGSGDGSALIHYNSASGQPYRGGIAFYNAAGGTANVNISSGVSSTIGGMTSRLFIDGSGNVGINTMSPNRPLHIAGVDDVSMLIEGSGTTNGPSITLNSTGTSGHKWTIANTQTNAGGVPVGSFLLYDASLGAQRFVINPAGNVSIGYLTTSWKFHVAGVGYASAWRADQGGPNNADSSTNGFSFGNDGDTGFFAMGSGASGQGISMWNNNIEVIRMGTTPTGEAMSVYGKADFVTTAGDHGVRIRADVASDSQSILQFTNYAANAQWGTIQMDNGSNMTSVIGGTVRSKLNSAGLEITGVVRGQGFVYTSDKSLKKEIETIQNPLETISRLRGVNFSWKQDNAKDLGFIAQEVEGVVPRAVVTDKDSGLKSVKYGNLIAIVIEAIKELKMMVLDLISGQDELKKNQEEFRRELAELRAENKMLRQQIMTLDQKALPKKQEL